MSEETEYGRMWVRTVLGDDVEVADVSRPVYEEALKAFVSRRRDGGVYILDRDSIMFITWKPEEGEA